MRRSSRALVVVSSALALAACGGPSSSSTGASSASSSGGDDATSSAGDAPSSGGASEYDFEDDALACMPGSTSEAPPAARDCPPDGDSPTAAIRDRVRLALHPLSTTCSATGRVVVRLVVGATGEVTSATVVSSTVDSAASGSVVDALRGATYCPSRGAETVIVYPIVLQGSQG